MIFAGRLKQHSHLKLRSFRPYKGVKTRQSDSKAAVFLTKGRIRFQRNREAVNCRGLTRHGYSFQDPANQD